MLRKISTVCKPSLRQHVDNVLKGNISNPFNSITNGVVYVDAKSWPVEEIVETTDALKKENFFVMSCRAFKTMRISKLGDPRDSAQKIFPVSEN